MSFVSPNPMTLSKLKYHIMKKYKDDPEMNNVMGKLGPYYIFKLTAELQGSEPDPKCYTDIATYIANDKVESDDIDYMLCMHTRCKKYLQVVLVTPGVLTVRLKYKLELAEDIPGNWSDCMVDAFPINQSGLTSVSSVCSTNPTGPCSTSSSMDSSRTPT